MELYLDLKNYDENMPSFRRTAARAVIQDSSRFLLIHGKYGDYKFPGGGLKKEEDLKSTLMREVTEETGYLVLPSSLRPLGKVLERRKGEYDDILEMESFYFLCEVGKSRKKRRLDAYEEEYEYKPIWISLEEAILHNRQDADVMKCPWVVRDTMVMEYLVNKREKENGFF